MMSGWLLALLLWVQPPFDVEVYKTPAPVAGVAVRDDTLAVALRDGRIVRVPWQGATAAVQGSDTLQIGMPLQDVGVLRGRWLVLTRQGIYRGREGRFRLWVPLELRDSTARFTGTESVNGVAAGRVWVDLRGTGLPGRLRLDSPVLVAQNLPAGRVAVVSFSEIVLVDSQGIVARRRFPRGYRDAWPVEPFRLHHLVVQRGDLLIGYGGVQGNRTRVVALRLPTLEPLWQTEVPGHLRGCFAAPRGQVVAVTSGAGDTARFPRSQVVFLQAGDGRVTRSETLPLEYGQVALLDSVYLLCISTDLRFDLYHLANLMSPYTVIHPYRRRIQYGTVVDYRLVPGVRAMVFWGHSNWYNVARRAKFWGRVRFLFPEARQGILAAARRSRKHPGPLYSEENLRWIELALEGAQYLMPESLEAFRRHRLEVLRHLTYRRWLGWLWVFFRGVGIGTVFLMLLGFVVVVALQQVEHRPRCRHVETLGNLVSRFRHNLKKIQADWLEPEERARILEGLIQHLKQSRPAFEGLDPRVPLLPRVIKGSGRYLYQGLLRALKGRDFAAVQQYLRRLEDRVREVRGLLLQELQQAVRTVQSQFPGVSFSYTLEDRDAVLPPCLPAETRAPLVRLFEETLRNAAEAVEPLGEERRKVEVKLVLTAEGLEARIRDWGEGISVDPWTRIFTERFSTKGTDRGRGLTPNLLDFIRAVGEIERIPREPGCEIRFRVAYDRLRKWRQEHG